MDFTIGHDYLFEDLMEYQVGSEYQMEDTPDFEIGRSMMYFCNSIGVTELTFILTGMTNNQSVWTLVWLAE